MMVIWIVLCLFLSMVVLGSVGWSEALIRLRLGPYRRPFQVPEADLPLRQSQESSVLVVGGGVAGLVTAVTLARRGYRVVLAEGNQFLGGKLGSREVVRKGGGSTWVSHGFHAFFRHYYQLNRFLDSLGLRKSFRSIGEYLILPKDGVPIRFSDLPKTPLLNLIGMVRAGVLTWGEATRAPGRDYYGAFLEYDHETTVERYDQISFADFDRASQIPPRLKVAFNTFARAFFADEDRLSLGELIKSFHFFYLSHDGGLIYDFPESDYEFSILAPVRSELEKHGAELRLGSKVASIVRQEGLLRPGFLVDGERFDRVVVATCVGGAQKLLGAAEFLEPSERAKFASLRPGQRYAVLRLWADKDIREGIPVFVITEGLSTLDSVTAFHRFEREARADLATRPGAASVLELHSYAVPDELPSEAVRERLLSELVQFFPELASLKVLDECLEIYENFTAFHVGCGKSRPATTTSAEGLYCAGDWVKLPFPAMLLEAAASSGYLAANEILKADGLQQEPIDSVPLRGLMAGIREPQVRKRGLGIS